MQILHAKSALSSEKTQSQKKILGALIRQVRKDILGIKTQSEMAAKVGVNLDVYRNWENGRSFPNGMEMLSLLSLCPEPRTLQAFGIPVSPSRSSVQTQQALGQENQEMAMDDQDLSDLSKQIERGLRRLAREKQEGNRAAAERLRLIVESIVRITGIATDPSLPRARRSRMLREALAELVSIDHL